MKLGVGFVREKLVVLGCAVLLGMSLNLAAANRPTPGVPSESILPTNPYADDDVTIVTRLFFNGESANSGLPPVFFWGDGPKAIDLVSPTAFEYSCFQLEIRHSTGLVANITEYLSVPCPGRIQEGSNLLPLEPMGALERQIFDECASGDCYLELKFFNLKNELFYVFIALLGGINVGSGIGGSDGSGGGELNMGDSTDDLGSSQNSIQQNASATKSICGVYHSPTASPLLILFGLFMSLLLLARRRLRHSAY